MAQGFMVRKTSKIHSPLEFDTASNCVQTGTTNEQNVADFFKANDLRYEIVAFATADEALKGYGNGRCDTYTSDLSQLYFDRLRLADPSEHVVLQKIISKKPLGPAVRRVDDQWHDIVKWTLFAMLDAEELGVTQKNIDQMSESDAPELKGVFGSDANLGQHLGLTRDWVVRIVKAVGNYGESFDRNLGAYSELGIARGLNRLWIHGGLQYAPPIR
jgi:general L-amino acid transport system substrate-binding protein